MVNEKENKKQDCCLQFTDSVYPGLKKRAMSQFEMEKVLPVSAAEVLDPADSYLILCWDVKETNEMEGTSRQYHQVRAVIVISSSGIYFASSCMEKKTSVYHSCHLLGDSPVYTR